MATSKDPKVRAALAAAMKKVVKTCGGQQAAAEQLKLSQSGISDVCSGKGERSVRIETLVAMRDVLGCSIDELLGLKAPKKRKT